ncbi:MAG: hypothetical protein KJ607_02555 [Bacteroidetes bacterium]|nr:hypothetical protein [Bacteroidota bacterium]
MTDRKKFHLANDLISKIAIFDRTDRVVFAGDDIKTILKDAHLDPENFNNPPDKENPDLINLIETVQSVRQKRTSKSYKADSFKKAFMLFPANLREVSGYVVLALEGDIVQFSMIERDLKERVRELQCLYNISRELESPEALETILERCVNHIAQAFQIQEITSVRLEAGDIVIGDEVGDKPEFNTLQEDIIKNGRHIGRIVVTYHEKRPFLKEEVNFLKEISGKIARAIEKEEKALDLEKRKKILTEKNKTLLELTEQCRQSREKLETFFNAITDNIFVIDTDFNLIMSNNSEIGESGKCYRKLFASDSVCENCPAMITFAEAVSGKIEKKHDDRVFVLRSYPIFNAKGNVDQVLEVCRDVTKEKQMEFQLIQSYKLASLGKLVAGIAHEINNPNTFILGNIKIIKEAFDDILPILDKYSERNPGLKIARLQYNVFRDNILVLLEDMVNGSVRMKKIVEDLRNFARKDEGQHTDTVVLNEVIEHTIRILQKQVRTVARLETHLDSNIPPFTGNIPKLEQVLVNLIINASQAIEKEDGLIRICSEYLVTEDKVRITIEDNGKGIEEKALKYIFDPFFTTKRNSGGTGLGLSISYGIIKEHGGKIEVKSKTGKGTVFSITIPVKKSRQ